MEHFLAFIWYAAVWSFIVTYQVFIYHFLCVAIDKMPAPDAQSGKFYRWFFGVMQYAAANYTRGNLGVQGKLGGNP